MSDQREFKVGDQVTIIKSGAKMYIRGYRGKHQVAISSSMDCEVAGVFDVSEITAGHRIDEPIVKANAILFTTDVAEVKDAVREAFEKSEVYRQWAIAGMPKDKQRLAFGVFEARQAEVDQLQQQCNEQAELGLIYESQLQEKQKRVDEQDIEIRQLKHFNDEYQAMLKDAKSALEKALGGGV